MAEQTLELDLGNRLAHLRGLERARGGDRLGEHLHVGDGGGGVVVGRVAEPLLVLVGERLRVTEPIVLQLLLREPRRHAEGVLGVLAERAPEVGGGHADRIGIEELGAHPQALRLADEVEAFALVPAPEEHVRVFRLDEREDGRELGIVLAILLVHDDIQPRVLEELARAVGDRHVEGIVGADERNRLRLGIQLHHHLDRAVEVVVGRRQGAEDVLVPAAEDLARGAAALHHGDLVLLRHRGVVEGVVRGERSEEEVHFLLRDELHVLPHAEVHVGLAVEHLQSELVLLPGDRHAALLVDLVDGQLVAVAVVPAGVRQASGELHGGSERDLIRLRGDRSRGRERAGKEGDVRRAHSCLLPLSQAARAFSMAYRSNAANRYTEWTNFP